MASSTLVWLRNDLRIADNPALAAALRHEGPVHAVYVLETDRELRGLGGAAKVWLHESLAALSGALAERGVRLSFREGESGKIIPEMVRETKAERVYWNRRYDPAGRTHDAAIKTALRADGAEVASFNASLLVEPWDIATKQGTPYGVFTPFWTALREKPIPDPIGRIEKHEAISAPALDFGKRPAWAGGILERWAIGEDAAKRVLSDFLDDLLADYPNDRDLPRKDGTSRMSPHLRFGEIGPRQIWFAVRHLIDSKPSMASAGEKFLSEVAWREFSYHLLYHRDDIARHSMQERFDEIEWRSDSKALKAWQKGQTGIPIVDAGMRQLWQTGWMHNRVRMLTASLLTKNLLIDWRKGENWFWDTLVDADPANNPASWQWVAGSGADAAPYFRIFNPVTQGEKFDPHGDYVRQWVPELSDVPDKWVHKPWAADPEILNKASLKSGTAYPAPIVDLKASRERALSVLKR
ncbi:cryptochrome/photolyase family protein [Pelagibacterium halotolerans]|uniref:Deoxyribodipyrimidine photo-lyase n=1 Tax=Pelagibacterium halotolerans (strain DSM 22347 / JCM 15775 / CGMCC 1.7692 / B2) TaxID=1082931 RepID=G4R839_PELHB|nr:deoxyribodipyrimidine photo-lyase [Pelagibacterium halotolerans]AEQ51317.1 deoxyribodipyrimidine photolyase [Pelagibacterium halotolerans B2]QJR18831.1 deoxyribodipyrimidine photo-lyase [Pelagibacterium halotolerans]SEA65715.1 deoxyribodipyrimidine photo-lyase [Pelagibacterium halotolerans]